MNKRESTTDNSSTESTACTASNIPVPSSSSSQGHSSHNHEDQKGHSSHDSEVSTHISSPSEPIGPGNPREIDQASGSVDISDRANQLNQIDDAFRGFPPLVTGADPVIEVKIFYDSMPAGYMLPLFKNYNMDERVKRFRTVSYTDGNDFTAIRVTFSSRSKSSCFVVKHPLIMKLHKNTRNRLLNAERNNFYDGNTFTLQKKHLFVTLHAYIFMLELKASLGAQYEHFLRDNQNDFGTLSPASLSMAGYCWPLSYSSSDGPNIRHIERVFNGMI